MSSYSSSHRNSSTLKLNISRNKPLPPIILDTPQSTDSQCSSHTKLSLDSPNSSQLSLPTLSLSSTSTSSPAAINDQPSSSIFQPKTLKRRNLKKLTLSDSNPSSTSSFTLSSPLSSQQLLTTPNSSTSSKNEDLELIENFEKLAVTINKTLHIRQQDLLTLKTLGEGQSGTVSQVLHLPTNKVMAKKQILFEKNFKVQNQVLRELKILSEVRSPYIVEFYGGIFIDSSSASMNGTETDETLKQRKETAAAASPSSQEKEIIPREGNEVSSVHSNGVLIFMEFMDCKSLDFVLEKLGFLKEVYLSKIIHNVLQGLNYLYQTHKIIHRDIKPSNVLLNSKGEVKICDFGVSRELNNNSIADTFVGTSTYMSPERIQGDVYSIKGDVWSVGLLLIELSTGEFPFGKKDTPSGILDLLQRIVNEDPPTLPRDKYSKELCNFVDLCLKKQNERPTPYELLNMPKSFLRKYDKEESGPLLRHLAKKLKK